MLLEQMSDTTHADRECQRPAAVAAGQLDRFAALVARIVEPMAPYCVALRRVSSNVECA
jgi:hypothetical protein